MARLIKAIDKAHSTVIEVGVTAASEKGAKLRGAVSLLGRRPGEIPAVENVRVTQIDPGFVNHYRVEIEINDKENIRDFLRINDAISVLEDNL